MNLIQSLNIALSMLAANKVRSALTMLGIIIGVMGVTVTVEMVEGFRSFMSEQFQSLGSDVLMVFYDPGRRERGEGRGPISALTTKDIENIRAECTLLEHVSGELPQGQVKVSHLDLEIEGVEFSGVEEPYFDLRGLSIETGRGFDASDMSSWANHIVLGHEVAEKLFPKGDAVGKDVMIRGRSLRVIGTLVKRGAAFGQNNDKVAFIPLSAVQKRWLGTDNVAIIWARPRPGVDAEKAMDQIWETMMRHHDNRPVFQIASQEAITAAFGAMITGLGVVFAGVAGLALLVGGIGIMNIMLVSVTERTREIGLRMAVGAKRYELLFQFLVEAATLSLIGGLIGMALGYGLGAAVDWFTHSPMAEGRIPGIRMTFPVWAAIGASVFSAAVGIVFGLYPAWRAARLDPIEALRHE
ncbi:MAG: ABC transporter permease [Fimbriimonadia bacterium]